MVSPGARPSQGLGCAGPQPLLLEELAGALLDEGASEELAGWAVSLDDSGAVAEVSGVAAELAGLASELLDSRKDEIASASELLMGSWLSGISTALLELLFCDSACSVLFCCASFCSVPVCCAPVCFVLSCVASVCLELSCFVSAGVEESDAALSSALTLLELGWDSSEDEAGAGSELADELADELSSQAFSVNAAIMPSDAASALLAAMENCLVPVIFFFSIFIFQPFGVFSGFSLGLDVVAFEGGDHAAHRSADAIGAEVYLATNVYGRASRKPIARVVDVPDGGLAGRRTCRIGGFA